MRLLNHERGSVSIYFIAATAAIVLLSALLIDFARVAAFRKQSELSVKSGIRSVMSSFDPVFYSRYGLFIRGGELADQLFEETLAGNAGQPDNRDGVFAYLDTRWEDAGVIESRPLADHGVFRRQVLEEMKYKAPIDLTIELAARLRGMTGMLEDTQRTVDALERMQKAYDRREEALDRVLEHQRDHGAAVVKSLSQHISYPPASLMRVSASGEIHHIADAAIQYDDYVAKRQDDEARRQAIRVKEEAWRQQVEDRRRQVEDLAADIGYEAAEQEVPAYEPLVILEEEKPRYEALVASYESGVSRLASGIARAVKDAADDAEDALSEALEAWSEAMDANEEMSRIAKEAAAYPSASAPDGEDAAVTAEQAQAMADLRSKAAEMVLPDSFFATYEDEIERQRSAGQGILGHMHSYRSSIESAIGSSGQGDALIHDADVLQREYAEFLISYGESGTVRSARQAIFDAHRTDDAKRKQEEQKAKDEWAGAMQLLDMLTGQAGSPEEQAAFERLNGLLERNLDWNEQAKEQYINERTDDPSDGRDESISLSIDFLSIVEDILIGARDQLYFSEYANHRMSRYEPSYVKDMLSGRATPLSPSVQQTEYILYGIHNPSGNIAAAYGEIFAIRLAIRTMEGFVECGKFGNPLLVLVAALVYGITNAIADLNMLVNQGSIPLSKYAKIPMTYADYLRLFLLLHGGSHNQMARMIAVIEHETGVSLTEAYTYASGEATSSVRLWFFPGLLRILGIQGGLGGKVIGNRYEATYSADMAYQ